MSLIIRFNFLPKEILKLLGESNEELDEINDRIIIERTQKKRTPWILDGISQFTDSRWPRMIFINRDVGKWPRKTDIQCWNCTLNISNPPVGIPIKIDRNSGHRIYITRGCFCSFSCAKAYDEVFYNGKNIVLLNQLYRDSGQIGKIKSAPNKILMIRYGGTLTDQQYKNLFSTFICSKELFPPMVSMTPKNDIYVNNPFIKKKNIKFNISRKIKPFNVD